jgi:hypothetical protein
MAEGKAALKIDAPQSNLDMSMDDAANVSNLLGDLLIN